MRRLVVRTSTHARWNMADEFPSPVMSGGLPAAVVEGAKVIGSLQGVSFNGLRHQNVPSFRIGKMAVLFISVLIFFVC